MLDYWFVVFVWVSVGELLTDALHATPFACNAHYITVRGKGASHLSFFAVPAAMRPFAQFPTLQGRLQRLLALRFLVVTDVTT